MVLNFKLAAQGWDNLKKIGEDGWNGLMGVLTPSGGDIVRQVKNANTGPTPQIIGGAGKIPDKVSEIIPDSWSKYAKYAKYAAIGGAALIGLALLRR